MGVTLEETGRWELMQARKCTAHVHYRGVHSVLTTMDRNHLVEWDGRILAVGTTNRMDGSMILWALCITYGIDSRNYWSCLRILYPFINPPPSSIILYFCLVNALDEKARQELFLAVIDTTVI